MAEKTYITILRGLGVDPDATLETQEEFESQEWDYDVYWHVEADSLDEAVTKIAAAKQEADEAHECLEEMHRRSWEERGEPLHFG
ncbi:hypothetical protein KKC44_01770 [Patescibacteria group bacterium]|nr:hypothetical protein [Patescibacteria group bacterium]MBU2259310.1 hypothetical protein [Patescibacteria group bacterium]